MRREDRDREERKKQKQKHRQRDRDETQTDRQGIGWSCVGRLQMHTSEMQKLFFEMIVFISLNVCVILTNKSVIAYIFSQINTNFTLS